MMQHKKPNKDVKPMTNPMIMMPPQENFYVEMEGKHGFPEIYLFGEFHSPTVYRTFLKDLREAADKSQVAEVYISSPGGQLDMLLETMAILKNFETLVTITNSDAMSAGSMVWAMGTVRVAAEAASLMFHRETYGTVGKSDEIVHLSDHNNRLLEPFFKKLHQDILTEEEIQQCKFTQIYKSGKEMIESGAAISVDDYENRITTQEVIPVGQLLVDTATNEQLVVYPDATVKALGDDPTTPAQSYVEWVLSRKQQTPEPVTEETPEPELEKPLAWTGEKNTTFRVGASVIIESPNSKFMGRRGILVKKMGAKKWRVKVEGNDRACTLQQKFLSVIG